MSELVLASASPRRIELLNQIGVKFTVLPSDICENVLDGESPTEYTRRLALEKAEYCFKKQPNNTVVLAADTTVSIDGAILGKPVNEQDAVATLMRLSGRKHQVITAIAVMSNQSEDAVVVVSDVEFVPLTEALCHAYWQTGEPQDKAGSYAIQGLGATFVKHLSGSYSSVVGLPLFETSVLLQRHGIPIWQSQ